MPPSTDILGAIALVAENKIQAAYEDGAFDHLPGKGQPLALEDDSHLPPELRMAYKILKNSGHLTPSPTKASPAAVRAAIARLEHSPDTDSPLEPHSRLHALATRLDRSGRLDLLLDSLPGYRRRILDRLGLKAG
jgi:hypothetical protein